ncbi:MAG: site-specific DNA-methyltransferase [Planctomycetota bacterium]
MRSDDVKAAACSVHCGDNLPYLERLPPGCCDLIYLDPPFFTGKHRKTADQSAGFSDRWDGGIASYLSFMQPRLAQCHRVLAEHGTLYLHCDWRVCHHLRIGLDELFGRSNFMNEIVWHYRTGGLSRRWFARKHDTILVYARRLGKHRFHVLRHGEFRTDGLKRDSRGRPYKSTKKGRLYFNAEGPALTDVWDVPFLSTVSNERVAWPTQKPQALLERIILASSDPGDLVADFFCGSGTALAAAKMLGRRWLGCDVSPEAVRIAKRRLSRLRVTTL